MRCLVSARHCLLRTFHSSFLLGILVVALSSLWGLPARGGTAAGAVTPFVNAGDLRDLAYDGSNSLWLASNGGALRFDLQAKTWTQFPKLLGTGPRGNDLVTVAVDSRGWVWAGSADRGFTFYDPSTDRWDRLSEEWPDPHIRVIRAFGEGVYIGTQDGLSLKPTPNHTDICAEAIPSCIVPSYVINDYARMGDTLWVATQEGLGRFNGETWDSLGTLPPGSVGEEALSLAAFGGVLWEATGQRVRRLVDGVWEDFPVAARRLVVSADNLYAIGNGGIQVWDRDDSRWLPVSLPSGSFTEVRDLERLGDVLYLATDKGLARVSLGGNATDSDTIFVPPGLPLASPDAAIAVDEEGRIWVGTQGQHALVRYDGRDWVQFNPEDGLDNEDIFQVLSDRRGRIWVSHCCCKEAPRCRLDVRLPGRFVNLTSVRDVYGVAQEADGRIWAGTDGLGVFVLSEVTDDQWEIALELTNASTGGALASNYIRSVAVTGDGTYFGNLFHGLDYWPHGGDLTHGANGTGWVHVGQGGFGLLDDNVEAVSVVGDNVWVGTSSGLHRFRGGVLQSRCPTKLRGVASDQVRAVRAIVGDGRGGLWVGTENGLLYLEPGAVYDAAGGEFFLLDEDNSALPSNEVLAAAWNPVDGSVWVGTSRGIARIDPDVFGVGKSSRERTVLYPNPLFLAGSARRVHLGKETSGGRVTEASRERFSRPEVFDLTGRRVGRFDLFENRSWVWEGKNENGDIVAPGLYMVRTRSQDGKVWVLRLGVAR